MHMPKWVVRHHDPRSSTRRVLLVALLVAAVGALLFSAGRMAAADDRRAAIEAERGLAAARAELATLTERLALAERSAQVDRQAHEELRSTLAGLNSEILQLREELAFYRGIVSPADARRGVRAHGLDLQGAGAAWRYRLVLIQAMQHDRQAQGVAELTMVGTDADGPARVPAASEPLAYDFRYFQALEGDILLPDGFVPHRVEVLLRPRSEREQPVEQAFDWPAAISIGG